MIRSFFVPYREIYSAPFLKGGFLRKEKVPKKTSGTLSYSNE